MITREDQLVAIGALEAAMHSGVKLGVSSAYSDVGGKCSCAVVAEAFGYERPTNQREDRSNPMSLYDLLEGRGFNVWEVYRANDSQTWARPAAEGPTYGGFRAARDAIWRMEVAP